MLPESLPPASRHEAELEVERAAARRRASPTGDEPRLRRRAGRERTLLLLRVVLYGLIGALLVLAAGRVAVVLAPVATGLFLAYLLDPLVVRLERRRVPRPAAVALLLCALAALVTLVLLFLPPLVERELSSFADGWHRYETRVRETIVPWVRDRLHLRARFGLGDLVTATVNRFGSVLQSASGDIAAGVSRAIDTAGELLRVVVAVLLTPVFAVYFLLDYPRLAGDLSELLPPRHRTSVLGVLREVNQALASWLRGQLVVMLILGAAYAVGLSYVGIPLAIVIGLVTGLLAFVPYVGVLVGLVLALLAALLDYQGPSTVLGVLLTFGVVQLADALFVTPRIVGGRVGLSPVAVIFALSLGGELLGYAGLLLAVPTAAVCKVLLLRARRAYVESRIYQEQTRGSHPAGRPHPRDADAPDAPDTG